MGEAIYILGHSQAEIRRRRLIDQERDWGEFNTALEGFAVPGLPQPALFSETPFGGGVDAPHYAWLAGVVRTLLPQMVRIGVATAETVAVETLESRLRSAVVDARSQVEGPAQMCAWTSI